MALTPSTESAEPAAALAVDWPRLRAWPHWERVGLGLVVLTALLLRLHDYTLAPAFTDNADELQFTWAGLNLIVHGDPYTWSYFAGYASYTNFSDFGTNYPLVHHWMDHPPLFAYLMGGWVWLLGDREMAQVTPEQVRVIPVLLSTLSVLLVHRLGRRFLAVQAALAGAALLATAPGAVLLGREAEPEALQAVLLLGALLLTVRALDGEAGRWTVAGLLLCCLAAPLAKVPGVAVGGICAAILFTGRRWSLAAACLGAAAAALLLFALYGRLIDWALFVRIFQAQTHNRLGIMGAFDFIAQPTGVNRRLRDGWWLLGWIGLALWTAVREGRRDLFLVWPVAAYALTMLVMAGERQIEQYGWYKWIIYPEVYLAAGFLAWQAVSRPAPGRLALLLALGGATAVNWLAPSGPNPFLVSAVLLVVLAPALLLAWRPFDDRLRTWAVRVAVAAFALMLLGNLLESIYLAGIFTRL